MNVAIDVHTKHSRGLVDGDMLSRARGWAYIKRTWYHSTGHLSAPPGPHIRSNVNVSAQLESAPGSSQLDKTGALSPHLLRDPLVGVDTPTSANAHERGAYTAQRPHLRLRGRNAYIRRLYRVSLLGAQPHGFLLATSSFYPSLNISLTKRWP